LKIEGPSLALGGEYGGAATYVTEHSGQTERGYTTSYIQTTARLGIFLALLVIGLSGTTRTQSRSPNGDGACRPRFAYSACLLGVHSTSVNETSIFQKMKEEGRFGSTAD
jgi:MFS family permease